MASLFNKLPEGAGKAVNKKQLQDFVKGLLFEKSQEDIKDLVETDYAGMSSVALSVIQAMNEASKSGDFGRLRPLWDFAFEREGKARK